MDKRNEFEDEHDENIDDADLEYHSSYSKEAGDDNDRL